VANNNKKATVTVNNADFDELLRREFNGRARLYGLPRGMLLSRAMFLVCQELLGEIETQKMIGGLRRYAHKKELPFKEEVVVDTDCWKKFVSNYSQK
jgi:hypothetical protein